MKRFLRLVPTVLLAAAAPLLAQTSAAKPASGAEWGAPVNGGKPGGAPAEPPPASAASAAGTTITLPPLPPRPPSAFANARASSQATGDYFHDFGELIVRVRSVKWIEEICSETFPATAEANRHAYADWLVDHGSFVDEVEGQFLIIEKFWGEASEQAKKEGLTVDQLRAKVDANRVGLRQDFHSRGMRSFQVRCEAYPEILLQPQLNLERSQAELVRSVRLGPR
ncbi:MAG: hypothetical protein ABJD97_06425 [Betaproteobacteria bacterium]